VVTVVGCELGTAGLADVVDADELELVVEQAAEPIERSPINRTATRLTMGPRQAVRSKRSP